MKVLLIFPPLWMPYRPYLSLPSLSAYLKSNGIDVVQKDFSIESFDLLLSEGYLKGIKKRLEDKFKAIDSKDVLTSGIEQEHYRELYIAKSSVTYVAERIEKAKSVFRSKQDFYDMNAVSNARNLIAQAQAIISAGCFPTGQDLIWPFNALSDDRNITAKVRTLADIKKLTQNRDENPFLELYEKNLLPFIIEQDPDIIGISISVDSQWIPSLTLGRLIKSYYKKAHVVAGGHVITLLSDVLMKYKELFDIFFDSAVLYEGERPLLKLVEHISKGQTLEDVPNLVYLDSNGKVRANEVLPPENMNSLPTPCFDGLPLDSYLSPEPVLPILSSRGCYWGKCAFCSNNIYYRWGYQNRDANKVVDDMQELSQKHGVTHFAFADEATSPSSASKLSEELIRRGMNVRCSTNIRLEHQFTPELCNKMFKAGFKLLYLGLESGCNRILNIMEKGITREIAVEVCRNVYDAGICNYLHILLGFPTESRAEAQETIDFLLSNKNIIHSFNIGKFILIKGAPTMKYPERYGISGIDIGPDDDFNTTYSYTLSSGLTSSEALELKDFYRDRLFREYFGKRFFNLYNEDILLYLSHFEKCVASLSSITEESFKKIQPNKRLTVDSIPRTEPNLVLGKLRFNMRNIVNNKNLTVYPNATFMIFNPVSVKFCQVNLQIVDILAVIDGRTSVEQIAHKLSSRYGTTWPTIEEDCFTLLEFLSGEGYVLLS